MHYDNFDREGKGDGNSGEDPKTPAWRVGIQLLGKTIRRLRKGKCLCRLQLVPDPAGCLQVYSWTLPSWHSLLWSGQLEGTARDIPASPEVLVPPFECFQIGKSRLVTFVSQLNLPCSWPQNLAFVLVPKLLSLALISLFKPTEVLAPNALLSGN